MKVLGIIAEYNPFHNGHLYHIDESKRLAEADCCIVCMSGNFVQRGEAALFDKWRRAAWAVEASEDSANLVVELPFIYACNRAEHFAKGAVEILAKLGITELAFGCESEDFTQIEAIAKASVDEEPKLKELISKHMKDGYSYVASNELALNELLGDNLSDQLRGSNNILAIEYMKNIIRLKKQGIDIKPLPIKRKGAAINDRLPFEGFAGATMIRNIILESGSENCRDFLPKHVIEEISGIEAENLNAQAFAKAYKAGKAVFFEIVRAEILRKSAEELGEIYCVGEGLEHKLKSEIIAAQSLHDLVARLTSRRYTAASMRRILTYILLGLKDADFKDYESYARILAFDAKGRDYLSKIKKSEKLSIPLITNVNKLEKLSRAMEIDLMASDMYNAILNRDLYSHSDRVKKPYIKV